MSEIKFNHDLTESLKKLDDSDSVEAYESLWSEFLKHIDEEFISANKFSQLLAPLLYLASDKFYDKREYQHALDFIVLFIGKWKYYRWEHYRFFYLKNKFYPRGN
tara:strand:+ start:261 stop:575 length:315 start_codon:yes stop_codon:yes gene_type:complete